MVVSIGISTGLPASGLLGKNTTGQHAPSCISY
jgi:hypothetical protein